jgi:thiamine-monophosphate kinase
MAGGEPSGEFGLIAWIRERSRVGGQVALGIGDDCASLRFRPGAEVLVTTDMLMDGRHFRLGDASPAEVGYKALAVNLSDIAAMAGRPIAAFVSVALPKANAVALAKGLYDGMSPLAESLGVTLAGGDTNAWDGPLVVSVTVLGETSDRGAVRRSGARAGDSILVTGPLGGSLQGRHLRPLPRVAEALAIAAAVPIRSMIDLSDGLSSDLGHILEESGGLGASLVADSIPIHEDARAASTLDGRDALDHALNDGEDFELCLTLAPVDAERLLADPPMGVSLFRVGTIEEEPGLRLRLADGRQVPLSAGGFDHLASTGQ